MLLFPLNAATKGILTSIAKHDIILLKLIYMFVGRRKL